MYRKEEWAMEVWAENGVVGMGDGRWRWRFLGLGKDEWGEVNLLCFFPGPYLGLGV